MVTNEGSIAEGLMDIPSTDIEDITGEKPKTARELAMSYSYIWEEHITHWRDIK
jgi:NAD(P)H dehydrogenase (quinone)